jgi:DNA-binding MarR family transcriptional regulator
MVTMLTKEQLAAWRAFLEAHAIVVRVLEREMQEEQGLPLTWYEVLVHLSEAPGCRLRPQALAQSVLLTRSGITRLVDRMVTAGLVKREPYSGDRRGSYVVMTEEGKGALQRAAPGHSRGVGEHFIRHLTAEEIRVLESVFARVLQRKRDTQREDGGHRQQPAD